MREDKIGNFYTKLLKFEGDGARRASEESNKAAREHAIKAISECEDFTLFTRKDSTNTTHGFSIGLGGVIASVCSCLHFTRAVVSQLDAKDKTMLLGVLNLMNKELNEQYGKE